MKLQGTERVLADRIRIQMILTYKTYSHSEKYSEEDRRGNSEEVMQSCTLRPCFHNPKCEIWGTFPQS